MAKPTITNNEEDLKVTYTVPKSELPEGWAVTDILIVLEHVRKQNHEQLGVAGDILGADAEIARLEAVKTDKLVIPAQLVGP